MSGIPANPLAVLTSLTPELEAAARDLLPPLAQRILDDVLDVGAQLSAVASGDVAPEGALNPRAARREAAAAAAAAAPDAPIPEPDERA